MEFTVTHQDGRQRTASVYCSMQLRFPHTLDESGESTGDPLTDRLIQEQAVAELERHEWAVRVARGER